MAAKSSMVPPGRSTSASPLSAIVWSSGPGVVLSTLASWEMPAFSAVTRFGQTAISQLLYMGQPPNHSGLAGSAGGASYCSRASTPPPPGSLIVPASSSEGVSLISRSQ
jgi:hypothetical protein